VALLSCALLIFACAGTEPEPPPADGMVEIAAGTVVIGSVLPKGGPPKAKARSGGSAPEGTGPPPMRARPERLRSGEYTPWELVDGQRMGPTTVDVASFRIDVHEVSRGDYARFLEDSGYRPPHVDEEWAEDWNWSGVGDPSLPIVLVNWYDARAYCAWAGKRLPSEAEWQLAALGDAETGSAWPWGDRYDGAKLNHGKFEAPNVDESDGQLWLAPVGSYPAGANGLHDAFGNAWEFTDDWRVEDARLLGQGPGLYVAVRGGSYYFDLSMNAGSERHRFLAELRRKTSGFRCAQSLPGV